MALTDVREWSVGPASCPRVVGRNSQMSGSGGLHRQMSCIGSEAHPDVREWSRGLPGCLGVVDWPSWMSGNSYEALPDVREW